jgi:DNA polymerase-4
MLIIPGLQTKGKKKLCRRSPVTEIWNKIFAKMGSDYKKPNAVTVIGRDNYRALLWPLPAGALFMVGRNTAATLEKFSIRTIGNLAQADEAFLRRQFGKMGDMLHSNTNGLDGNPVVLAGKHDPVKSISNGYTYCRDLTSERDIRTGLLVLADFVAARMRRADVKCATVQVTIKDNALKSITRQKAIAPTYLAADLVQACMDLIHVSWPRGKPIRLLTVTAQNLRPVGETAEQMSLFDTPTDSRKAEQLERAMDDIRERYGGQSIQHGSVLGNDLGIG